MKYTTYEALTAAAVEEVKKQYPQAEGFRGGGASCGEGARRFDDPTINNWVMEIAVGAGRSVTAFYYVKEDRWSLTEPSGSELKIIRLPTAFSFAQAVILADNDYGPVWATVDFYWLPEVDPDPIYFFGPFDSYFISVNARTGKVTKLGNDQPHRRPFSSRKQD